MTPFLCKQAIRSAGRASAQSSARCGTARLEWAQARGLTLGRPAVSSNAKQQGKAWCTGISLAFLGGGGGSVALQIAPGWETKEKNRLFSSSCAIFADELQSASSSILREATPSAARRPQTPLVFLTLQQAERDGWQQWVAYFRNEGFDCLLINAAVEGGTPDEARLGEELTQQLRLASLPVQPVVFAQNEAGARTAFQQLISKDPRASGLIVVLLDAHASDHSRVQGVSEKAKEFKLPSKLRWTTIGGSEADGIKQAEKWLRDQGFS